MLPKVTFKSIQNNATISQKCHSATTLTGLLRTKFHCKQRVATVFFFASCRYCFLFYQIIRTGSFLPLQTLILTELPWSPQVYYVSVIHQKRNYGVPRAIRPIRAHERTALFKSQSEVIIEIPGNTRGGGEGGKALHGGRGGRLCISAD